MFSLNFEERTFDFLFFCVVASFYFVSKSKYFMQNNKNSKKTIKKVTIFSYVLRFNICIVRGPSFNKRKYSEVILFLPMPGEGMVICCCGSRRNSKQFLTETFFQGKTQIQVN